MKKCIISFILGAIIFTGVTVLAEKKINADKVSYSDTETVKDKLDDLYLKTNLLSNKKFCKLVSGTKEEVGAKYECDPGDGVKRDFYILAVNNDNTLDLIMEHNLTEGSTKTVMSWMDAMDFFDNSTIA